MASMLITITVAIYCTHERSIYCLRTGSSSYYANGKTCTAESILMRENGCYAWNNNSVWAYEDYKNGDSLITKLKNTSNIIMKVHSNLNS